MKADDHTENRGIGPLGCFGRLLIRPSVDIGDVPTEHKHKHYKTS